MEKFSVSGQLRIRQFGDWFTSGGLKLNASPPLSLASTLQPLRESTFL